MGKAVAVSFEEGIVKVLYASIKGKGTIFNDAVILKDDQFDDFLAKEKTKEFVVVNSFRDFYQDTILIPPTKKRYFNNLIEAQVRKTAPFRDFSFVYTILGERIVEDRRLKEVFVFAVKTDEISRIIDRFTSKGKAVKALYPDIFTIASNVGYKDLPVLCVSEVGINKDMFLVKDGAVHFVRSAQSSETGLADVDMQNISMTVNYCRQTLRINPSFIMLTGHLGAVHDADSRAVLPVASLVCRNSAGTARKTSLDTGALSMDFISPASALLVRAKDINLLTAEYRNFFYLKNFFIYSTALFIAFSLLGFLYTAYKVKRITGLRKELKAIRADLPDIGATLSAYDARRSYMAQYEPFARPVRAAASAPALQDAMSLLSGLKTDNVRTDSISLTPADRVVKINIKGIMRGESLAVVQRNFQDFVSSASGLKGVNIKLQRLALSTKGFYLELEWSPQKESGTQEAGR